MKPITNDLRIKINQYIKNGIDISDLIEGIEIQGEDLSGAIIKRFNRPGGNINGCNFANAIIGEENKITELSSCRMRNCNFSGTKFLGVTKVRKADIRGSVLTGAYLAYWDYKFADMRGCNFCNAIICVGTKMGAGALFDEGFFKDFCKHLAVTVTTKDINAINELDKE